MGLAVLDRFIENNASNLALPPDLLRMAICLVFSYPLCALMKRLPDHPVYLRQLFVVGISIFYLVGFFSLWYGLLVMVVSSVFTYYFTFTFKKNPFMPWLNFIFLMTWLLINHMRAQLLPDFNVDIIDITGSQMVLVMKLSAFGWNVYDGTISDSHLSEFQKKRAVKTKPSILYFLSYALFFPCIFTGPSCDYAEFANWIDMSMFDEYTNEKKRKIPRSGRPALWKFIEGIAWIVLWVNIVKYINLDIAKSADFATKTNFAYRAVYLYLLGFTFRLKYYGAWCISEGACILSGLGFHGKDPRTGKYRWDRVRNINPWEVETAQNAFAYIQNWNLNTNKWLKNYIYLRVTPRGRKPGLSSTLATFVTSAVWHGTRPGYYLTFVTAAFIQNLGKAFRRNVRPIFMQADGVSPGPHKFGYDIAGWVATQLVFGYAVQPFILLDLAPSFALWKTVYFYGHFSVFGLSFVFFGPPRKFLLKSLKQFYPEEIKPLTHKELLNDEAAKLRKINEDLDEIVTLGVPMPDIDHMDTDIASALKEIDYLRGEISDKLASVRNSAEDDKQDVAKKQK